jgi:hypothetical protein
VGLRRSPASPGIRGSCLCVSSRPLIYVCFNLGSRFFGCGERSLGMESLPPNPFGIGSCRVRGGFVEGRCCALDLGCSFQPLRSIQRLVLGFGQLSNSRRLPSKFQRASERTFKVKGGEAGCPGRQRP